MESSKWGDMPGNGANFKLRQQRVMERHPAAGWYGRGDGLIKPQASMACAG